MSPRPFILERYFAKYEFNLPYLLSSSDCEPLALAELLEMASPADLSAWQSMILGYTESAGHPELRELIAGQYPGLNASDIITAIPEEAIYLTMRSLLEPGDRIVTTFPGYQSLYEIAASMGCEVLRWSPQEHDSGWRFDPKDLDALCSTNIKAIVVNFPHNPTGAQLSLADWQHISALAQQQNAWLISDEMYRGLEGHYDPLPPAASAHPRSISISGLSKVYGLAGLRCGWIATQDKDLLAAIQQYKDYTSICSSAPSERLSIIALRNEEPLRQRCKQIIASNLPRLNNFFSHHESFFASRPAHAGPICFPRLKAGNANQFCETLAAQAGIMLLPSSVYEAGDAHVRLGFGRTTFAQAIERLDEYLMQLN